MDAVPQDIDPRRRSFRRYVRQSFLTGAAIMVPILVTFFVLLFAVDFLTGLLDPAVVVLQKSLLFGERFPAMAAEVVALLFIGVSFFVVGAVAQSDYGKGRIHPRIEAGIASIPGLGSIYSSVNDLSEMLLERETESFREVKVVEYPAEGTYTLAFLTADSSGVVAEAADEERMVTLFRPMTPNPMGGFLIHVPHERVHDVDLTVEEGVQTILSTGVTLEQPDSAGPPADGVQGGSGSGEDDPSPGGDGVGA